MVTRGDDLDGLIQIYLEALREGEEKDDTIEDLIDRWIKWKNQAQDNFLTFLPFSEDELNYLNSRLLDGLAYAFNSVVCAHYRTSESSLPFDLVGKTVCEHGYLETCRWLYLDFRPHPNWMYDYNTPFRLACANGHLEIAKLLQRNLFNINVHAENEFAFRYACINGHLETAKWLLKHFPTINYRILNDWAFCIACWNGHLDVAKWLFEWTQKPEIDSVNWYEAINLATLHNDSKMVTWLQSQRK